MDMVDLRSFLPPRLPSLPPPPPLLEMVMVVDDRVDVLERAKMGRDDLNLVVFG